MIYQGNLFLITLQKKKEELKFFLYGIKITHDLKNKYFLIEWLFLWELSQIVLLY